MKICKDCKSEKPKSDFHTYKQKTGKLGYFGHCKKCHALRGAQWKLKNPGRERQHRAKGYIKHRKTRKFERITKIYNLTSEQYTSLLETQNNLCAICKSRKATDVDHDHKTEKIRGLLCNPCNRGLGLFKDSTSLLSSAILYLERP